MTIRQIATEEAGPQMRRMQDSQWLVALPLAVGHHLEVSLEFLALESLWFNPKNLDRVLKDRRTGKYFANVTSKSVIHLQFWAYGSWDSLFPILVNPTANL